MANSLDLYHAVRDNNTDLALRYLREGINPNSIVDVETSDSLVHYAYNNKNHMLLMYLVLFGANLYAVNKANRCIAIILVIANARFEFPVDMDFGALDARSLQNRYSLSIYAAVKARHERILDYYLIGIKPILTKVFACERLLVDPPGVGAETVVHLCLQHKDKKTLTRLLQEAPKLGIKRNGSTPIGIAAELGMSYLELFDRYAEATDAQDTYGYGEGVLMAAKHGKNNLAYNLLIKGARDTWHINPDLLVSIHYLCRYTETAKNLELLDKFVAKVPNCLTSVNKKGNSALIHAAKKDYWGNVRVLLKHSALLPAQSEQLEKLLVLAAKANQDDIVIGLLNRGVNPQKYHWDHYYAAQWAAKNKNYRLLNLLLIHGSLVNPEDKEGSYLLNIMDVVSVEQLMKHNQMMPQRLNLHDKKTLIERVNNNIYHSLLNGKMEYAEYFLTIVKSYIVTAWPDAILATRPAFLNADQPSMLHLAINAGAIHLVRLLLKNGAIDQINDNHNKKNALITALAAKQKAIFEVLLDAAQDLNEEKDSHEFGRAALYAAENGYWDTVRRLINQPHTLYSWFRAGKKECILHFIAAQPGFEHEVLGCITQYPDALSIRSSGKETPLVIAAKNKQWAYVRIMVEHSQRLADVEVDFTTVLQHAVDDQQDKLSHELIALGANFNRLKHASQVLLMRRAIADENKTLLCHLLWTGADFTQLTDGDWEQFSLIRLNDLFKPKHQLPAFKPQDQEAWHKRIRHAVYKATAKNHPELVEFYFEIIQPLCTRNIMIMNCESPEDDLLLHPTITNNNLKLFTYLLQRNASLTKQRNQIAPIGYAAGNGRWDFVKAILAFRQYCSGYDEEQYGCALLYAVKDNQFDLASQLVRAGSGLRWHTDSNRLSILHYLASSQDPEADKLISTIIQYDSATLSDLSSDGESAISWAAKQRLYARVMTMLSASIRLGNAQTQLNKVLLRAYSDNEHEIVNRLKEGTVDIDTFDEQQRNLLDLALERGDDATASYCIQFLLNDIKKYTAEKLITLIIGASEHRCTLFLKEVIERVLPSYYDAHEQSIDITAINANPDHDSLLHVAVRQRERDLVRVLVKNGLSLTKVNRRAETPFSIAIDSGDVEVVLLLLGENLYDNLALQKTALSKLTVVNQAQIQGFMNMQALLEEIRCPDVHEVQELTIFSRLQLYRLSYSPIKIKRIIPKNFSIDALPQLRILMQYEEVDMCHVTFSSFFNFKALSQNDLFLMTRVDRTRLSANQYYTLLMRSYDFYPIPALSSAQARLVQYQLKQCAPMGLGNGLISEFNNGQLYLLSSWLVTISRYITPENPLSALLAHDVDCLSLAFERQVCDFLTNDLSRLINGVHRQHLPNTHSEFIQSLTLIANEIRELGDRLDVETTIQHLQAVILIYRQKQIEHAENDLYHQPNNVVNRVYLMLCWLLAHSQRYKLHDLLPTNADERLCETLNYLALENVNFSDLLLLQVTLSHAVIPQRHALFYCATLVRENFRNLNLIKFYHEEGNHEEFTTSELYELFSLDPALCNETIEGHDRELAKKMATRGQISEHTLNRLYEFGEACWQNSTDSNHVFNQDHALKLQLDFKDFLESRSEIEKNILLILKVNVESRGNRQCTFMHLFAEMTYQGCSGQLGVAIKQWVAGVRAKYSSIHSNESTWYSRFFPMANCYKGRASTRLVELPPQYDLEGTHVALTVLRKP
jgi:ankyrin repeat protein